MKTTGDKLGITSICNEWFEDIDHVLKDQIVDLEQERDDLLELVMKIHDNIYEPDKLGIIIDRGMKDVTGLLFRDVKKRLVE